MSHSDDQYLFCLPPTTLGKDSSRLIVHFGRFESDGSTLLSMFATETEFGHSTQHLLTILALLAFASTVGGRYDHLSMSVHDMSQGVSARQVTSD